MKECQGVAKELYENRVKRSFLAITFDIFYGVSEFVAYIMLFGEMNH